MSDWIDSAAAFQAGRARWTALAAAGQFEAALALVDEAARWAREQGDGDLVDRALCGRAAISLELGRGEGLVPELRALLMRTEDRENAFLAAYTIARHYELARESRKGLFYARLARDRAEALDDGRRSSSLNLIANFLVSECRFDDALATYFEAESLLERAGGADPDGSTGSTGSGDRLRGAVIGYNVGYCRVVTGQLADGLARLYRSLRALLRLGATHHVLMARLDLAFALLEAKAPRHAARHAAAALELAVRLNDAAARKNGLYLAGAAAAGCGDEVGARRSYAALQGEFYPDADYLPDLLLRVDVRQLVNLKA